MDAKDNGNSVSLKKLEANRSNARLSTGPRTEAGKKYSRRNALKHGVLASALLIVDGEGAEDATEFRKLLCDLGEDLQPVGAIEEMLVERIAVCCWRQKRALQCEAGLIRRAFARSLHKSSVREVQEVLGLDPGPGDHLRLPSGAQLDGILRYETTIQRQLAYALNQLERFQRVRKGEQLPAPVNVQLSSDA
jgi:hypothetical protein